MADFRKKRMACILAVCIIAVVVMVCVVPWGSIFVGTMLLEEPERPKIERAEFSFTLNYKINGESKVIEDTLICEFDGIGADEGRGKYRKWKSRLASGNTNIILWEKKGKVTQEIYYNYAPPGYYMGDPYFKDGNKSNYSDVVLKTESSDITEEFISEKKLLQKYKIEIVSWECEEPIQNVFGSSQSSAPAVDAQETEEPKETDELRKRLEQYKAFLRDEDIKLSKSQWEKLKKPFLAVGSDQIVWKNISDIDFDVDH